MPESAAERKKFPVASGVLDYFPDAIVAISELSEKGNSQHNPGKPLHWDRTKSGDEADTLLRHFLQRGTLDTDGIRHSVKMAWRALALLQKEIESESTQSAQSEYPKYWLNRGEIYRAISSTCPGAYWSRGDHEWIEFGGRSMIGHAQEWKENYVPITAEQAKEKGAQV